MIKADIIIPVYNNAEYTVQCLESIRKHTKDYRIILIDNGSSDFDQVEPELEKHPHFLIRNPENLGFVKAVNQGIASSVADYVVIQNNDTIVEAEWLEKLIDTFKEPNCGLVGPMTIYADSWQNKDNCRKVWGDESTWDESRMINGMLAFFSVVIKREVIQKVGYLSEEYGIGFGDDDDYCERAKQAGFKLFLRMDVTIPHFHRTTFNKYIENWEEGKEKNLEFFKAKWGK